MALPKIDVPTYNLILPISKTEIVYRPYLTKEEKLLLMALESKEPKSIMGAITQVASNCVLIPKNLDIEKLPMVDIEYLFLNLRAKSKSEILEAKFECKNVPEGHEKSCGNILSFNARVDDLKVEVPSEFNTTIPLTDKIGVVMSLPKYKDIMDTLVNSLEKVGDRSDDENIDDAILSETFKALKKSIVSIYDGDEVYDVTDSSPQELDEFIDSLNSEQYKKIENFFENIPKINYKFNVKCSRCQFDHAVNFKDIASFF